MVAGYGLFGMVANFALFLNVAFTLSIMAAMGATLTLPGIAGIVLGLALAVDANVLIYERMREEARNGRSPFPAIDIGLPARLHHHPRFQPDDLDRGADALCLRLRPGARLRRHARHRHPVLDVHLGDGDPPDHIDLAALAPAERAADLTMRPIRLLKNVPKLDYFRFHKLCFALSIALCVISVVLDRHARA